MLQVLVLVYKCMCCLALQDPMVPKAVHLDMSGQVFFMCVALPTTDGVTVVRLHMFVSGRSTQCVASCY